MHDLDLLLPRGVLGRTDLAELTSERSVRRWLGAGDLVEVHPGVVVRPQRAPEWDVRAHAALTWTGGALSHGSALIAHGLLSRDTAPLHVLVNIEQTPRGASRVVVHRTSGRLRLAAAHGLLVTAVATSLVDAWAWAHAPGWNPRAVRDVAAVRQAVIAAVRERRVTTDEVRTASAVHGRHPGVRALEALLDLVERGCQSELEVFGLLHVLQLPGLPGCVHQHRVRLPDGRRVFLDAAWPAARVVVEMDGHRFHSSRQDRERDMRRDAGLSVLGWVVLRYSYERMTQDPGGCRREIAAVVARRLHERGVAG
ncbi:DUF559 domain-containing protein [Geodermatophilus sp. Leaf369]|uniref:DUF559 domain-containing protein n=1 Tax=Geodermatophilus sp. Leaf369 TaxID=1736354 RepID=UPI0012F7E61D|nr:DUF559 domain-containing protein [Geodermatophilus sp. Leaf369]